MAMLHGSSGEFDSSREDWTSYSERLMQYFAANDVEAAGKRRAILLSVCSASTYRLIRNLVAPQKPTDKSFEELVALVKQHHNPKPSVIVQRYLFNTRVRRSGETIAAFVAKLRHLTEHCDFGASLDDMLRDRLVCGIEDNRIQHRLLAEPSLTLQKAFDLALALESADRNAQDLQKSQATPIHALSGKQVETGYPKQDSGCYRCGGKHQAAECRFKEAECHLCKKKGHLARVCRSKDKKPGRTRPSSKGTSWQTHLLTVEDATEASAYALFNLTSAEPSRWSPPSKSMELI